MIHHRTPIYAQKLAFEWLHRHTKYLVHKSMVRRSEKAIPINMVRLPSQKWQSSSAVLVLLKKYQHIYHEWKKLGKPDGHALKNSYIKTASLFCFIAN